jgi:ATP-dependent Zn protease
LPKCNRVGCTKEATHHSQVDIGGMFADVWGCDEHFEEIAKSLEA